MECINYLYADNYYIDSGIINLFINFLVVLQKLQKT